MANSEDADEMQHDAEDADEMQHDAAFHQGLHCLFRSKQPSQIEIHHNEETSTCDPLKYKMGNPILIVLICMGKSTRIQRIKICSILLKKESK